MTAGAILFASLLVIPNEGFGNLRLATTCLSLAVMFVVWAAFQRLATASSVTRRFIVAPMTVMSQVAFMPDVLHHLLGYHLMLAAGLVTGRSWQGPMRRRPTPLSPPCARWKWTV